MVNSRRDILFKGLNMKLSDKIAKKLDNNNLLIVDSMNLAFRWKHQKKSTFSLEYMRTVESLAQSYDCAHIIVLADQGVSAYRQNICEDYKANRKEKYKDQTEEEKAEMLRFFNEYDKTLTELSKKYLVLRKKNVEADDLAAFIVKHRKSFGVDNIWLISSDKDWDLLVNDYVSRFSTVTRKETTVLNWDEHFDFPIEEYISYKVLSGDKGDNISGIPTVGPVRATQLINTYGSAFDIYDNIPLDGTYKYIQNINENAEVILRNYELMDLLSYCEQAIQFPGHSVEEVQGEIAKALNGD